MGCLSIVQINICTANALRLPGQFHAKSFLIIWKINPKYIIHYIFCKHILSSYEESVSAYGTNAAVRSTRRFRFEKDFTFIPYNRNSLQISVNSFIKTSWFPLVSHSFSNNFFCRTIRRRTLSHKRYFGRKYIKFVQDSWRITEVTRYRTENLT